MYCRSDLFIKVVFCIICNLKNNCMKMFVPPPPPPPPFCCRCKVWLYYYYIVDVYVWLYIIILKIFKRVYIPRTLDDVPHFERDVRRMADGVDSGMVSIDTGWVFIHVHVNGSLPWEYVQFGSILHMNVALIVQFIVQFTVFIMPPLWDQILVYHHHNSCCVFSLSQVLYQKLTGMKPDLSGVQNVSLNYHFKHDPCWCYFPQAGSYWCIVGHWCIIGALWFTGALLVHCGSLVHYWCIVGHFLCPDPIWETDVQNHLDFTLSKNQYRMWHRCWLLTFMTCSWVDIDLKILISVLFLCYGSGHFYSPTLI